MGMWLVLQVFGHKLEFWHADDTEGKMWRGITNVITTPPDGDINNTTNSFWNTSFKTENLNFMAALQEKSEWVIL